MKRVPRAITEAAVAGVGVLVLRPGDWPRWARLLYVGAPSALVTSGVAILLGLTGAGRHRSVEPPDAGRPDGQPPSDDLLARVRALPVPARWTVCVGVGLVLTAVGAGSVAADAGLERWMTRRGVRCPRLIMAGAAALVLAADSVINPREEQVLDGVPVHP